MNHPLKNMLTEKPTGWKIWYVIFPTISLVGASVLLGFALTLAGNNESLTSLSPILQFLFSLAISFGGVALMTRRKFTASDLGFDRKTLTK